MERERGGKGARERGDRARQRATDRRRVAPRRCGGTRLAHALARVLLRLHLKSRAGGRGGAGGWVVADVRPHRAAAAAAAAAAAPLRRHTGAPAIAARLAVLPGLADSAQLCMLPTSAFIAASSIRGVAVSRTCGTSGLAAVAGWRLYVALSHHRSAVCRPRSHSPTVPCISAAICMQHRRSRCEYYHAAGWRAAATAARRSCRPPVTLRPSSRCGGTPRGGAPRPSAPRCTRSRRSSRPR